MGDKDLLLLHQFQLIPFGIDTVGHDGGTARSAEQAKMVIGVTVVLCVGAKFPYPGDLSLIFRQVRLDWQVIFVLYDVQHLHKRLR